MVRANTDYGPHVYSPGGREVTGLGQQNKPQTVLPRGRGAALIKTRAALLPPPGGVGACGGPGAEERYQRRSDETIASLSPLPLFPQPWAPGLPSPGSSESRAKGPIDRTSFSMSRLPPWGRGRGMGQRNNTIRGPWLRGQTQNTDIVSHPGGIGGWGSTNRTAPPGGRGGPGMGQQHFYPRTVAPGPNTTSILTPVGSVGGGPGVEERYQIRS